jgi:hypothetical protein
MMFQCMYTLYKVQIRVSISISSNICHFSVVTLFKITSSSVFETYSTLALGVVTLL